MKPSKLRYKRWSKYIPKQQEILDYRLLKPVRRFLDHHRLWQFNRRSVAGGFAIGLFFSVATPVAQILFAAIAAVLFKVNLPVAVFATLLTNPLTTPAILYIAFKLGAFLVGHSAPARNVVEAAQTPPSEQHFFDTAFEWVLHSFDWIQSAGLPLVVGLGVLAVLAGIGGYVGVSAVWRLQAALRWRSRSATRRQRSPN